MNPEHIHLILNHFPILGIMFAWVLLCIGLLMNKPVHLRIGLVTIVLIALITIPAFLTGEEAEEVVEELPGISHELIHDHEEAGELGLWLMEISGIIALVGIMMQIKQHPFTKKLLWGLLVFSMATLADMVYIGLTGGKIRHSNADRPATQTELEESGVHKEN